MPGLSNMFKICVKPRKSKKDAAKIVAEQGPKQFSFKTLSSATEGFNDKNKLGEGGFAQVYKGKLNDGREIAVKKPLQISEKGKELALYEMNLLLGCAHHRNIVKFLGFCSHRKEMLLVFEFASNGGLDHLLFNSTARANALDWKRTYAIIIGVARGLLYLHEQSHSVIIHCDIKPANILIDENWVPKIADFGTARLFPQDQMHVNISEVAGTLGYAAFEYLNYGRISPKVDTYSFGVVVLELISGKKYRPSHAQSSNAQSLRDRANELYKKGKVSQFMDRKLIPSAILDQVQLCVQIGVMCTQLDPKLRPTMHHVHSMLSKNYSRSSSTLVEEPMRDGHHHHHPQLEFRIVPEIKVDKERLAANDAKEDFWQAITKLKSLETSFKKNLNDGGNKSSWCEEGFFEEGEEGKYKDQLTNPQDAIFTNNWEGILRKVGGGRGLSSLLRSPTLWPC